MLAGSLVFILHFICMYCKYIIFSLNVKHDSYFGVLMAYGGLQDVRRSHHISLFNGGYC